MMFGMSDLRKRVEALETAAKVKEWKDIAKVGDGALCTIYPYGLIAAKIANVTDDGLEVFITDKIPWRFVHGIKPADTSS